MPDQIFVVDDEQSSLLTMQRILAGRYVVSCASSGAEALEHLAHATSLPNLILLDLQMPQMGGLEVFSVLRTMEPINKIPVVFLTDSIDQESEISIVRAGAMDLIRKPIVTEVALRRIERILELYHFQQSLQDEVDKKTAELKASNRKVQNLIDQVMLTLAHAIDAKDKYTRGHSLRVAAYSREIARRMGKTPQEMDEIYRMGLLHDIGKIGIPDEIINKPTQLTEAENEIMHTHPTIGANILHDMTEMPNASIGAHWHHEHYDGSGYPDGLKGEEIPESARIIGVADAYDAMTSKRCYRDVMPQDIVEREIEKGRGTQFDAAIADVMLAMIREDTNYNMREK